MGGLLMRLLAAMGLVSLLFNIPGAWGAPPPAAPAGLALQPPVEKIVCLTCHTAKWMKPQFRQVVPEWRKSIHYRNGVACNSCHGGNPHNAALAMSPKSGFVGVPTYNEVPQFCGKCHIGIYHSCLHCAAMMTNPKGPNCVTCHSAHDVQKATINIINPSLCGRCHSYAPAKVMKTALMQTETKMNKIDKELKILNTGLISTSADEKILFRTREAYRSLFHTIDVPLVKEKTAEFDKRLAAIQTRVEAGFRQMRFRRYYAIALILIFFGLAITILLANRNSD
jgi:hypothetical protein